MASHLLQISTPVRYLVLCLGVLLALPASGAERRRPGFKLRPAEIARYGAAGVVGGVRLAARAGLQLGRIAGQVSGVTSLGLVVDGGVRLARAKRVEARVEATRDLAAGVSGLGRLGFLMSPLHVDLGLGGAGLQVAVGAYELSRGLCRRDRPSLVLGALDLGAGALFGASLLACLTPYTAAGAIVLTAARAAYANRDLLRSTWTRLGDRLRGWRRERRASAASAARTP